ncbi:MAG: nitrophenyl compound nitroreductase subunit ArsF family protein [Candidatus Omnitrophota bacterium]
MKKNFGIFLLLAAVALASNLFFGGSATLAEEAPAGGTVTAYYFHGTFRCPTCHKLEAYAKEAIENNFRNELASGKLSFKIVNIENKGNEHFVKDYQLYTKSVVLSLTRDGKEIRSKNLDKIWEYVRNKDRYENYVRDEVAAFLKEA